MSEHEWCEECGTQPKCLCDRHPIKVKPNPTLDELVKEVMELIPWEGKDKPQRYERRCVSWEKSPNFYTFKYQLRILLKPLVEGQKGGRTRK